MRLTSSRSLSHLVALVSVVALAACGGSPPPAAPGEDHEHPHDGAEHGGHEHGEGEPGHGEHGEHHGHEHGEHHVDGPLKDFHGVIAPVWHSEPGAKRVEAACTNVAQLKEKAGALGTPPAAAQKDEAGWKADVATLVSNIDALATACGASGRPDVEPTLSKVHDGFHKLMERVE